jgi:hypothetical protein
MSTSDSKPGLGARLVAGLPLMVTVILGGIGAAAGFEHTHDWAEKNGQHGWLAWADAVVIEGIAIVAGFQIHHERHHPYSRRKLTMPWGVLVIGFGIQMACQVALAPETPWGWLLAAVPALGFLAVVKMLMRRLPATPATPVATEQPEEDQPTEPALAPAVVTAERVTPHPVPAAAPAPVAPSGPRLRLPGHMVERVTAAIEQARGEGREPTTEDVQTVVKVNADMAAQLLADLTRPAATVH